MLSEPASLRTETPGEEKAGKPCCYALPVGTRPRLKQISHKNVKHWVMAEYHMYRTFTTRSLLLSVPPRATTLQSPLQPAPLETEKSLEHSRQVTHLHLPRGYAKALSPFQFQHFIFHTENRVQALTFLYVQHLLFSTLSNPPGRSITKDIFYSSAQHSPPITRTGSTQAVADFSKHIQLAVHDIALFL